MARASRAAGGAAAPEPLAEWEREILAGSADVAVAEAVVVETAAGEEAVVEEVAVTEAVEPAAETAATTEA